MVPGETGEKGREAVGVLSREVGRELGFKERKRREDEQHLLAVAGELLSASLDFEETLVRFGEIALHAFADIVVLDVVEPKTRRLCRARVLAGDTDPSVARRLEEVSADDAVLRFGDPLPVSTCGVLRRGLDRDDEPAPGFSREQLCALREAGAVAVLDVALIGRDGLVATALLVSLRACRANDARELWLVEELARRATTALENARLYHAAREATQARDEIMGIVAHDLRNPLTSILLSGRSLLMKSGEEALDERHRSAVRFMLIAAERMKRLVDDLLEVRRQESGALVVERSQQSAAAVAAEAVYALEPLAELASLTFVTRVQGDLPEISVDRERIVQVLSNLVGNAIKFTPAGGMVLLEVKATDHEVVFSVRDNGRGIEETDLPFVFERFFQAKPDDRKRGTGLGLSIAKALVEAHDGRIWVESERGEGSTFSFALPIVRG